MRKALTQQEVIDRCNLKHNNRYDYSKFTYVNGVTKSCIICLEHGEFWMRPKSHMNIGNGCPTCGKIASSITKANNILRDKFKHVKQPDDYKLIPLTQGLFTKVDNDDFERIKHVNWNYSKGYASNKKGIPLHRLVMNCIEGEMIDHINRDKLDNRKSNLRLCNHRQNGYNREGDKDCSSRYKGVTFHSSSKKWQAQIKVNDRNLYLGLYNTEIEAAQAYDIKAKEVQGYFSCPNIKNN